MVYSKTKIIMINAYRNLNKIRKSRTPTVNFNYVTTMTLSSVPKTGIKSDNVPGTKLPAVTTAKNPFCRSIYQPYQDESN